MGRNPHGVEWEEGGREAYGVEKNPGRVRQAVEEHAPLTALPWGTQESGARRLRVGERAGGSGGRKGTSETADWGET